MKQVLSGNACLYKRYNHIGHVETPKQKATLEASAIRSKIMADLIYDFSCKGTVLGLVGNRHCLDFLTYVPDLCHIYGYHPINTTDSQGYHMKPKNHYIDYAKFPIGDFLHNSLIQKNTTGNRLKSDFNIPLNYLYLYNKNI